MHYAAGHDEAAALTQGSPVYAVPDDNTARRLPDGGTGPCAQERLDALLDARRRRDSEGYVDRTGSVSAPSRRAPTTRSPTTCRWSWTGNERETRVERRPRSSGPCPSHCEEQDHAKSLASGRDGK